MTDLPKTKWEGEFNLCGVKIRCYVLDDEQRIINANDMIEFFEAMANGMIIDKDESSKFAKWTKGVDEES